MHFMRPSVLLRTGTVRERKGSIPDKQEKLVTDLYGMLDAWLT